MNSNTAQNESVEAFGTSGEPVITNRQKREAEERFGDNRFGITVRASLMILNKSIEDLCETAIYRPEVHEAMIEQTQYTVNEARILLGIAEAACERMKAVDAIHQAKSDKVVDIQCINHFSGNAA